LFTLAFATTIRAVNLSNKLTVSRIALTAFFVMALLLPHCPFGKSLALTLFLAAALTDWWDGWLARRWNQETLFGALLDPLADKLLTTAAFVCFIEQHDQWGHALVQAWMVLVIVAREFLVTGLRLVARGQDLVLKAERWGKHKTASQMFAIFVVLVGLAAREDWGFARDWFVPVFVQTVRWLMLGTVALTVWSGGVYFYRNRQLFFRDA